MIDNFSLEEILLGIADIEERLKNIKHVGKISVCVEKIIEMFVDEMEDKRNSQKSKKKKNKKSKKKKSQKKEDISKETEITAKINEGNVSINMPKNIIEINQSVNSLNKIEERINDKYAENALDNPKLNILNLLNNILNKIKMGNEVFKEDIDNLQNLIVNIVDGNNKLKKDVEKLTKEMQKKGSEIEKLNQENKKHKQDIGQLIEENVKQNQDIENLKERVGFLEEDFEDMKDIISKIQFRDLSKNFLKCFNDYLTDEELKLIKKSKDLRGQIISNRIEKLYPNADKSKMEVIKKLVKSSSDLICESNYSVHSITISEYENEIDYYKKEKKLEQIQSPVIFCFVYFLGISQKFDDLFENSYTFLRLFFNRNLKSAKSKDLLDNYFIN